MALPEISEAALLAIIVNKTPPQDFLLKLFTSDLEPSATDDASRYREANGHGYRAIQLHGSRWTITTTPPIQATYPQQTFSFTGPLGKVFGYFVVQAQSGTLMWAARFPSPFIAAQQNQIKISPIFALLS
jgi:hypothetical protein